MCDIEKHAPLGKEIEIRWVLHITARYHSSHILEYSSSNPTAILANVSAASHSRARDRTT